MSSCSILQVHRIIIVVLQGDMDDHSVKRIQQTALDRVAQANAPGVILDVSQLDTIDSYMVRVLTDLSRMAKLLGAETVIVGLQAAVVMAMVEMGLDFTEFKSAANIDWALEQLGVAAPKGRAGEN